LFITVHPGQVSPDVLALVDTVLAVGKNPGATLREFGAAVGVRMAGAVPEGELEAGEILFWSREAKGAPFRVRVAPSRLEHRRHSRKYTEGELPPERSFYFRGPKGKLNLRAQNLMLFNQIAEGVDDATWMYHLRRGDYSRWFRERIKDEALAADAERIERLHVSPAESRQLMRASIERRYTLPTAPALPMPGTDAAGGRA
jgi:hypothetical protein